MIKQLERELINDGWKELDQETARLKMYERGHSRIIYNAEIKEVIYKYNIRK